MIKQMVSQNIFQTIQHKDLENNKEKESDRKLAEKFKQVIIIFSLIYIC